MIRRPDKQAKVGTCKVRLGGSRFSVEGGSLFLFSRDPGEGRREMKPWAPDENRDFSGIISHVGPTPITLGFLWLLFSFPI